MRTPFAVPILAALLFAVAIPCTAIPARATEAGSAGVRTLGEALEQLRAEGVETLYTSRLVDASAPIPGLPAVGSAEDRLRALLEPLGLMARSTSDGQFVIGLLPTGMLEGTIRSDPGGQVIALASIRLLPDGEVALSDAAGRYRFLRVPEGSQNLEITRPGYLPARSRIGIEAGARHRLDVSLRLDAEASDEILVSTTPEEPPLGTWQAGREQTRAALAIEQDVLGVAGRLPGTNPEGGVAFGVRGHDAERLTLIVDGIEIAEPYHFRHLGTLAGAVTPNAIDDLRLHRGSPPIAYGNRAGGVLEVLTETTGRPLSARLVVGEEAIQTTLGGNAAEARLRWLVAYRKGQPKLPPAGAGLEQRPDFWDGLAKLTYNLHPRHELTLQSLQVSDNLSVEIHNPWIRAVTIEQDSRYSQLRYLGALGKRHLLDLEISRSEITKQRFAQELEAPILTPPGTNEDFVIDHQQRTERTTGHADGVSSLAEGFEWRWGAEIESETTTYDYMILAPFLGPQDVPFLPDFFFIELDQERVGLYSQATWRPRDGITLSGGLRYEDDDFGEKAELVPRFGASFRIGSGVWQLGWSRVRDSPGTHELPLADGEFDLPGTEISEYASMGYQISRGASSFSIEVYDQRIEDPRLRFENLFQSVSRVPELELDRYRMDATSSRSQGAEVRYDYRGSRLRGSATYELGRFEDRLEEGAWRPRRSDRRHALHLALTVELPFDTTANILWRGSSGRWTTPIDLALATEDFEAALGAINSQRLPAVHQLDLRLSRTWELRTANLGLGFGIDNLYDRRNVRGLDPLPIRRSAEPLSELPIEVSRGRDLRFSIELSW